MKLVTNRFRCLFSISLALALLGVCSGTCVCDVGDLSHWGTIPLLALAFNSEQQQDLLHLGLCLSPAQLETIVELTAREEIQCASWLTEARALIASATMTSSQKQAILKKSSRAKVKRGFLTGVEKNLKSELSSGQLTLLKIWLDEHWRLLLGRPAEAATGARQLTRFLEQRIPVSEQSSLERIRQAWTYYKTVELTLRKKILKSSESDHQYEMQYLRMARKQANTTTKAFLDETQRNQYTKLIEGE